MPSGIYNILKWALVLTLHNSVAEILSCLNSIELSIKYKEFYKTTQLISDQDGIRTRAVRFQSLSVPKPSGKSCIQDAPCSERGT